MALVGDIIVEAREAFPDPCQVYALQPSAFAISAVVDGSGTLPAGTYYLQFTFLNPWGETLPSLENNIVVGGGGTNAIQIAPPAVMPFASAGFTLFRVYIGNVTGGESFAFQGYGLSVITITGPATAKSQSGVQISPIVGVPPIRSSAWLPDTDGGFVSAMTMYRWINDGLQLMSRIAGGIPGMTGVQAVAGQAIYRIPGKWIKLTNAWFDGWPLSSGKRGDVFLHNTISGVSGLFSTEEWMDQMIVQIWPQPNRTGAQTNLPSLIGTSDGDITVASSSGFLPLGLAILSGIPAFYQGVAQANQIQTELISYTGTSVGPSKLLDCVRGIGGTQALGWPATSTQATEANLRFAGFRQPQVYSPGQSFMNMPLPLGWEVPLSNYIVAQYRRAEQQEEQAQAMEKAFKDDVNVLAKQSRGKQGPIQIGSITREVYPGGYGGGILIP